MSRWADITSVVLEPKHNATWLQKMISDYVPAFLGVVAIVTYILELWTGIAVAGWSGEQSLIEREKKPGPYWFVMALQTMVLIVVPILIAMN